MFFKKSDTIFCGTLVPGKRVTDLAKGQIGHFKQQGYSVVLLKIGEKPHIEVAEGHNKEEIYKDYISILRNGNV